MNKILFIDACVSGESRTRFLAKQVLSQLEGRVTEAKPAAATMPIVSEQFILSRNDATARRDFSDSA